MTRAFKIAIAGLLLPSWFCSASTLPPVFAFDSPDSVDASSRWSAWRRRSRTGI